MVAAVWNSLKLASVPWPPLGSAVRPLAHGRGSIATGGGESDRSGAHSPLGQLVCSPNCTRMGLDPPIHEVGAGRHMNW